MAKTTWRGNAFKAEMNVGSYKIAYEAAGAIERLAKKNMNPLYNSNYRWSLIHPDLKSENRTGLARASIHLTIKKSEFAINIGSDAETMKQGVEGKAGSNVYYFPYLEFGTWAIPPLAMLRKAFDEVKSRYR
jgi:hypothetical protein